MINLSQLYYVTSYIIEDIDWSFRKVILSDLRAELLLLESELPL